MKKVICSTTIYPVREALEKFDQMKDWTLVVAGDLKTPADFKLKNGIYLSPKDQEKMDWKLSEVIGWNCIQRRNFAFLMAKQLDADVVATIDDDNIPYDNWGHDVFVGRKKCVRLYETDEVAFDPISGGTEYTSLWHRGFPIQLLRSECKKYPKFTEEEFDIQVNFWDGDPDIDAFCRIEHAPDCEFSYNNFPFTSNAFSPFNSQNTIISKHVLPHYMMFPHVGRMDDIWPSYYVQSLGYKVAYHIPTVYQDRNPQDLTKNLVNEFNGYQYNLELLYSIKENPENIFNYCPVETQEAFNLYQEHFE